MALNFSAPAIDFSPLGNLGATYDKAVKSQREADMNDARQKALATFGQGGDLAALGKTLLTSGDLEGGMAALRLQAANEGTPWQKAEAARQASQYQTTLDEQKRRDDDAERARREAEERTRRPERITGVDKYDNPREGMRDPVTGVITWEDGTQTRTNPGPRSGGTDDPNLPAPNAGTAQLALSPQTSTDPGYVIPGTLQGFPVGTELPPGGLAALAPPAVAGGAAVAAPAAAQAVPLAPPAPTGGAAVAQTPAAAGVPGAAGGPVPAPPITATQINQGTTRIPPMSLEEQYQESQRLGMSMKAYRAMRADLIKKDMESQLGSGQTTDMKNKLANARLTKDALVQELDSLNADVQNYGTELVRGPVKARMQVKKTNIVMLLKDMYALGALQKGDIEQIDQMITDPTSDNPIEAGIKAFTQKGITESQVKAIKRLIAQRLQAAEGSLGGDPSKVTVPPDEGAVERAAGKLKTSTGFNATW